MKIREYYDYEKGEFSLEKSEENMGYNKNSSGLMDMPPIEDVDFDILEDQSLVSGMNVQNQVGNQFSQEEEPPVEDSGISEYKANRQAQVEALNIPEGARGVFGEDKNGNIVFWELPVEDVNLEGDAKSLNTQIEEPPVEDVDDMISLSTNATASMMPVLRVGVSSVTVNGSVAVHSKQQETINGDESTISQQISKEDINKKLNLRMFIQNSR